MHCSRQQRSCCWGWRAGSRCCGSGGDLKRLRSARRRSRVAHRGRGGVHVVAGRNRLTGRGRGRRGIPRDSLASRQGRGQKGDEGALSQAATEGVTGAGEERAVLHKRAPGGNPGSSLAYWRTTKRPLNGWFKPDVPPYPPYRCIGPRRQTRNKPGQCVTNLHVVAYTPY
ncbi:hypothetical protein CNECB9_210013 [Cupriavidus necator]|uniref:Uncharacterized protein n=1 Tax=Cupriavidus necator TaxID=106590 RepID=A0A1K0IC55_CUPNE|nr:hypothetical protein CNECB9_210013 [Cupriavidus necator]